MQNGEPVLNPNHCQEIITAEEAYDIFLKDVKIAETRAKKTGLISELMGNKSQ